MALLSQLFCENKSILKVIKPQLKSLIQMGVYEIKLIFM